MKDRARRAQRVWSRIVCWLFIGLGIVVSPGTPQAEDVRGAAIRLSTHAFALLDSVSIRKPEAGPNALLGPVASLAADAEALNKAVTADKSGSSASASLAALNADRRNVDTAIAANPGSIDKHKWAELKGDLEAVAKLLPAAAVAASKAAIDPVSAAESKRAEGEGTSGDEKPPAAKIESIEQEPGDIVHFKGYLAGRGLRSAGIYLGSRKLRSLKIDPLPGSQRVNLDIQLERPEPGTVIRVYDRAGRSAEAQIVAPAAEARESVTAPESAVAAEPEAARSDRTIEVGSDGRWRRMNERSPNVALGAGVSTEMESMIRRGTVDENDSGSSNTAEIPTSNPRSPSKAHVRSLKARRFGDVQIRISSVQAADPMRHEFQIAGQIAGSGIERAAIFVDGRESTEIPVTRGEGFTTTSFSQSFEMDGRQATIRVFGPEDRYIESSIRLEGAPGLGAAIPANSNQLAVQINSLQPANGMIYAVAGTISGRNLASAALFQNGMAVQQIAVTGGLLGGLVPSIYRQVNFNVQYNAGAGMATIRVFDTSGGWAEQPLMAPVGASPLGTSPYGYGPNPFAGNPYGGGVNPYGNAKPGYSGYNMNPGYGSSPSYGYPNGSANQPPASSSWWFGR
jgi:hypothetical protein